MLSVICRTVFEDGKLLSHLKIREYHLVFIRTEWFIPYTASKYINSLSIFLSSYCVCDILLVL